MIEKLQHGSGNCTPCYEIIEFLEEIENNKTDKCVVAEIGVDIGATSIEIIKRLKKDDEYWYFDFKNKIDELTEDFIKISAKPQYHGISNTSKSGDSYAWNLAKIYMEWEKQGSTGRFDLVYMDGAHDFLHDGAATAVIKEMMVLNGIIVFDDVNWTISNSPTMNPKVYPGVRDKYTDDQIQSNMVGYVCRCIMDTDIRFKKLKCDNNNRAIYQRIE